MLNEIKELRSPIDICCSTNGYTDVPTIPIVILSDRKVKSDFIYSIVFFVKLF